jgi:hypothetical protein
VHDQGDVNRQVELAEAGEVKLGTAAVGTMVVADGNRQGVDFRFVDEVSGKVRGDDVVIFDVGLTITKTNIAQFTLDGNTEVWAMRVISLVFLRFSANGRADPSNITEVKPQRMAFNTPS